jgi:tripartite-type tricarboxylate transporter receptor subunit TctC
MRPKQALANLAPIFTLLTIAMTTVSHAQTYPVRPVRVIVGFSAGGATDVAARVLSQKLSENLGQQVIVDNRPGAAGNLAAELVARAPGDGYTILLANATIAIPSLFNKLPFDVRKDYAPISLVGHGPSALAVHPSLPVKSVKDVIALAKRKPDALNYSSGGAGNITHLAMELFNLMTKTQMVHIPYKGGAPSTIAVMTGETQLCFCTVAAAISQIKQGKLNALAVSSLKRSAVLPNVPTVIEAGLPDYEASSWYALLAPTNTPAAIVNRLSQQTVNALETPATKNQLAALGIESAEPGSTALAQYMAKELVKWETVVRNAKIPPQ